MISLILLVLCVAAISFTVYLFYEEEISGKKCAYIVAAIVGVFLMGNSFQIIPTGHTGVKVTLGQVGDDVLQTGVNFKFPLVQRIVKVNNRQQDKIFEGQIYGEAMDKTVVWANNIIVTYQINPESSAYIYKNIENYKTNLISQPVVNSAVKAAMASLSSDDVTKRSKIEPLAKAELEKAIAEKYGADMVFISKVTIDDMDYEDTYNKAIAAKQNARQEAERQAIENQKAVDIAKANQEKAKIEAETMVIAAQAEAEAYKIKSEQITDKLLKKWELDARKEHGWVTIQGASAVITQEK